MLVIYVHGNSWVGFHFSAIFFLVLTKRRKCWIVCAYHQECLTLKINWPHTRTSRISCNFRWLRSRFQRWKWRIWCAKHSALLCHRLLLNLFASNWMTKCLWLYLEAQTVYSLLAITISIYNITWVLLCCVCNHIITFNPCHFNLLNNLCRICSTIVDLGPRMGTVITIAIHFHRIARLLELNSQFANVKLILFWAKEFNLLHFITYLADV